MDRQSGDILDRGNVMEVGGNLHDLAVGIEQARHSLSVISNDKNVFFKKGRTKQVTFPLAFICHIVSYAIRNHK